MRTIDLCKKGVHLTALVIMVECAGQTGSLIIPKKPDKLSPAWTASIDFYPAAETRTFSHSRSWWPQRQRWRVQSTRGATTIKVRWIQECQVIPQGQEHLFYGCCIPQVGCTCCDPHVKPIDQKRLIKYPTLWRTAAETARVLRDGKISELNTEQSATY